MKSYYIESIIEEIALEIKKMIDNHVITKDRKIVLYGLNMFSFGMRTILANYGFGVDSYISNDPELVMSYRRSQKAAGARYFNSSRDMIRICNIKERLIPFDETVLVISADKNCSEIELEELSYKKNVNFFQVYVWGQNEFEKDIQGKKSVSLEKIQNVEKDMLGFLDQFCMKQGIRYWVCGGTLLGTIRHKGFIPWDDDIDVFMPWKDYLRFMEEFIPDEKHCLMNPDKVNRKEYYNFFAKLGDNRTIAREDGQIIRTIHPVAIDIFPLIGVPGENRKRLNFFKRYYELEHEIWEDFYAQNGNLDVYNKWYPRQREFLEMYDFDLSDFVGVLSTGYRERDCTNRQVYDATLRMPFEDIEVNVPTGYEEYLDNLYGKGWMRLPDEEKRVSHHGMEAYWL